jgi:5-methylcytosine-specific restriction endonuclease McrA
VEKPCYYCGVVGSMLKDSSGGQNADLPKHAVNGVDRLDPKEGYTPENCVPACDKCNRAKNDWTLEEFKKWVRQVYLSLHTVDEG